MRAQQCGITEDFFLICSLLQSKYKLYLGCDKAPLDFPVHLPRIANKLLLVERQTLISLAGWEVALSQEISFEKQ